MWVHTSVVNKLRKTNSNLNYSRSHFEKEDNNVRFLSPVKFSRELNSTVNLHKKIRTLSPRPRFCILCKLSCVLILDHETKLPVLVTDGKASLCVFTQDAKDSRGYFVLTSVLLAFAVGCYLRKSMEQSHS
jgi:hypothetical protein